MAYTVGEMARRLGVPASTIRYYDKEGLLPFVGRSSGGIRVFTEKDFEWLRIIGCMKKAGMSIRDIRQYIEQAQHEVVDGETVGKEQESEKISFWRTLSFKQTWAFAFGKFMTDGVWWFFLFWTPSYLNSQFGIKMSEGLGVALIFTLYAITMLSIYGGKLPTIIINKTGLNPYAARMRAMLIFAFIPLLVLLAQPMGTISPWFPIILIGLGGAAHQSWSANIFSTIGDMFPKSAIATVTGIGGMAGGVGSMILQWFAGWLFVHAEETNMAYMGFEGKPAGYFVVFCICAVAYLIGWIVMKALVPKYKPIVLE